MCANSLHAAKAKLELATFKATDAHRDVRAPLLDGEHGPVMEIGWPHVYRRGVTHLTLFSVAG
jgi:hypothetical protein